MRRESGPEATMRLGEMALHRFSVFLAICTLLLVMAGASVTSNQAGLSVPDWPLSYGQVMPEMKGGVFYEHGHRMIASAVGFLTIILAVWLWRGDPRNWLKRLGWAALAAVIVQGVLGGMTVIFMLPKPVSIAHACLAQVFFCTTVAVALFTSRGWLAESIPVEDHGWPPLRAFAFFVPGLVLLQIALGAGYRHQAFGIMPHVVGAIVISALVLVFAVSVLVQFPSHNALRRAAWPVTAILLVQVLLGVAAYLTRMNSPHAAAPDSMMVVFTVAHVGFGALTMASCVILAIQVLRHVRSRTAEVASGRVPAVS